MSDTSTRLGRALQGLAVAVVASVVGLEVSACGGGSDSVAIARWQQAASSAITPMAQRVPTMAQQAYQWEQGTLDAAQYRPDLATTLAVMSEARDRVAKLPQYPGHPAVDRLYLASMMLYVASVHADQASLAIGDAGLRRQIALLAERVRELGDRVFDQGRLAAGQSLVPAGLSGAKVQLPAEVPDWTAEGLAPGPPLAPQPAASVSPPGVQPKSGPGVRKRLRELVRDEAQLSARAADLAGPSDSAVLHGLSSELTAVAGMVG